MCKIPQLRLFNRASLIGIFLLGAFPFLGAAQTAPVINSPTNVTGTEDAPFTYEITTVDSNATIFGNTGLPAGLTRNQAVISGFPETPGTFTFTVRASNSIGTSSQDVTLVVGAADPVITSPNSVQARSGLPFSFTITATNAPDTFAAIGLPDGLTINPNSGIISGTPTEDGNYDVVVTASNGSAEGTQVLRINLLEEIPGAGPPAVEILSPSSATIFEGSTQSISISAQVTPSTNGVIDTVFARWTNPPSTSGISEVILVELESTGFNAGSGAFTYTGTAQLGFNPNDRELGGGNINLEVVAFETSATSSADVGTDSVNFQIKPIVSIVFPTAGTVVDQIAPGDLFASVRLSTNNFESVTALVSGPGIIDQIVDSDNSDNENGIFNFFSGVSINLQGIYSLRIIAVDGDGNTTVSELDFSVSDTLGEPVAVITSPTPGFVNEVFSAGLLSFARIQRTLITVNGVDEPVGVRNTYVLELLEGGQGYFPRNGNNLAIPFSTINPAGERVLITIPNVTVTNGRITSIPDQLIVEFPRAEESGVFIGEPIPSDNAVIDNLFLPGNEGRVRIAGAFFKAAADLDFYRLIVNGEDVTPGDGNLDPVDDVTGDPLAVDIPVLRYPLTTAPPPGDYVAYAEITDKQGEVGISDPISFTILPFEPLNIELSRSGVGDIDQGDEVTFFVDVEPFSIIDTVEFFDSASGESLGEAASVTIDGEDRFRFVRSFDTRGDTSFFAVATGNNGQTVRSSPQTVTVLPVNDLQVSIIQPGANLEVFRGETVLFEAEASATPGIQSVTWVEENVEQEPALTEGPFEFARTFNAVGTFRFRVDAVDNFGNRRSSENEILVTVREPDISVVISAPQESQTVTAGTTLDFEAGVTSELNVASVTWLSNGVEVDTVVAAPYAVSIPFVSPGTFQVTAQATDIQGFSDTSPSITITVLPPEPLANDSDFIRDTYNRIAGRLPSQSEFDDALEQLNSTISARAAFVADLLASDVQNRSTFVQQIFRTMTGEWPNSAEIGGTITSLTEAISSGSSETGVIGAGGTESFTFNYTEGSNVSVEVTPNASESGIGLVDATLTIVGPNGNNIGFSDDSVINGNPSLNPRLDFIAPESGEYTAIVGGFSLFNFGGFTINSSSTGSSQGSDTLSAQAAVQFLIPEFEERFGPFLNSGDVNTPVAVNFVERIFRNKHGTTTTGQSLTRLVNSLRGGNIDFAGFTIPGYGGNVASFVGNFAIDNDDSGLLGASGFPLTRVHLYSRPNDSLGLADIALLISNLQGLRPTDARVAALANQGLTAAIETVLRSDEYISQFIPSSVSDEERQQIINDYLGLTSPSVLPPALVGSDPLGSGWHRSDWFGSFGFDSSSSEPWVFSRDLGWVYVSPSGTPDGVWLFSSELNTWLYGSEDLGHFFFNSDAGQWIWVSSNPNSGSNGAWLFFVEDNEWQFLKP